MLEKRNLDFGVPLTRDQWTQITSAADFIPDDGVLSWTPAEPEVIRVAIVGDDAPPAWRSYGATATPPGVTEREVARVVYNDGRPFAQLEPPSAPAWPAVQPHEEAALQRDLERWVRDKWHGLMEQAGITHNLGAIAADEPNPPHK